MAVDAPEELDWQVRAFVYRFIAEETLPPTAAQTVFAQVSLTADFWQAPPHE